MTQKPHINFTSLSSLFNAFMSAFMLFAVSVLGRLINAFIYECYNCYL